MAKDPAALIFIDKWIAATQGMKGDAKGWFLDLILYQFDKGSLPNDLDELAAIARIRPSEYSNFEHVFEHVLKQKFKITESGTLENPFAKEIIQGRSSFKEKRSAAGKSSYFSKFLRSKTDDESLIQFIIKSVDVNFLDTKDLNKLEQVFKQKSELYINVDVIGNKCYLEIPLIENEDLPKSKSEPDWWRASAAEFMNDVPFIKYFSSSKKIEYEEVVKMMREFVIDTNLKMAYKDIAGLKSHFTNRFNKRERDGFNPINNMGRHQSKGFVEAPTGLDYENLEGKW